MNSIGGWIAYWTMRDAQAEAQAAREFASCQLCNGTVRMFCRICYQPIATHSHEGDFVCEEHGLVDAVTEESLRALRARLEAVA